MVDPSLGHMLSECDVYESILIQSKYDHERKMIEEKVVADAEMDSNDYTLVIIIMIIVV